MTTKLICIQCPRGCELTAEIEGGEVKSVTGNFCKKGRQYAQEECVSPKRVLTTTVRLSDGRMLPVKTDRSIDKSKLLSVIAAVNKITPTPPIKIGQTLAENIDGTGANIIATKCNAKTPR
jgi:CxxC motif-containing protein